MPEARLKHVRRCSVSRWSPTVARRLRKWWATWARRGQLRAGLLEATTSCNMAINFRYLFRPLHSTMRAGAKANADRLWDR